MGEAVEQTSTTLLRIQSSLDLLHGTVANIDMAQQHMRAQMEHQAAAIADSSTKHNDTARILSALADKLQILERGGSEKLLRAETRPDLPNVTTGKASVQPASPCWTGNVAGASSSGMPHTGGVAIDPGGEGILGGGGCGGVGSGRPGSTTTEDAHPCRRCPSQGSTACIPAYGVTNATIISEHSVSAQCYG
jgi:hypothetical protein